MKIGELLDKIRALYVERLEINIKEEGEKYKIYPEPAMLNSDGVAVRSGELISSPNRMDIVSVNENIQTNISVDSSSQISFANLSFNWSDKLLIKLAPFTWDNVQVNVTGLQLDSPNWSHIENWFLKAFEEKPSGHLSHCAHFISDPSIAESGWDFVVDLGSASVTEFENLLDSCEKAGFTDVSIGVRV